MSIKVGLPATDLHGDKDGVQDVLKLYLDARQRARAWRGCGDVRRRAAKVKGILEMESGRSKTRKKANRRTNEAQ